MKTTVRQTLSNLALLVTVTACIFTGNTPLRAQSFVFAMSDPIMGATDVDTGTPLVFSFTAAMKPAGAVVWSNNIDSTKILYNWSADGSTLTCTYPPGWPGNSTIRWELDPDQFKAVDGSPLITTISGSFRTATGSSTTTPCQGGQNSTQGTFNITKGLQYSQASALTGPPTVVTTATFSAALIASPSVKVSSVFLKSPNGTRQEMLGYLAQSFVLSGNTAYSAQADLDAAYPDGTYQFQWQLDDTGALGSTSLSIPAGSDPPTPWIVNFAQTQNLDSTADFSLQFTPFAGAGANDVVSFTISSDSGAVFQDPDACVPRSLDPTANSLTIPAGTLSSNKVYQASLSFIRVTDRQTPAALDEVGLAMVSKTVQFSIHTAGPIGVTPPKFTFCQRGADGSFSMQFTGQAAASYQFETSTDLQTWKPLVTTNSPNGIINFTDSAAIQTKLGFYRAKAAGQ